jgi:putative tryptophan/tyrosine transport system substrate-binding protein
MQRRHFITLIAGAAAAWPALARAQQPERVRRIGVLTNYPEDDPEERRRLAAFNAQLQELGWVNGRNLRIDTSFTGGSGEHVRTAAVELAARAPEVILSTTSTTGRALLEATNSIPIVSAVTGDPIALGFTTSMSQPTGNITGFTTFNDTLAAKRLQLLREIVGTIHKVALMWVPANSQQVLLATQTENAAKDLGIELVPLALKSADDIASSLAKAASENAEALLVAADPLTLANSRVIIEGCISRSLPCMHTYVSETRGGALISYGIDPLDNYRRAADYVSRILKGAKVANLPFQEPTRLTLSINLGTARAIRINVPPSLLAQADDVIE